MCLHIYVLMITPKQINVPLRDNTEYYMVQHIAIETATAYSIVILTCNSHNVLKTLADNAVISNINYKLMNITPTAISPAFTVFIFVTRSASVAEWLRAWDTLTMFEATVCGRS